MQLLIRRNQKTGLLGGAKYTLYVRAQLTEEEKTLVKKNNLADELLVYHGAFESAEGLAGALLRKMRDTKLTVGKLIEGTDFTCENVGELLGVEDQVKHASLMLKSYLDAAATFGGEEVLDMDKILADTQTRG